MDRKTIAAALVLLALLCVGLFSATRSNPSNGSPTEPAAKQTTPTASAEPDAGTDDAGAESFVDETAEGRSVRIVRNGEPVAGAGTVSGAPGSYPPELSETADDGLVRIEHAATEAFGGELVGWVEVYSFEGDHAAWEVLDLTEQNVPDIELVPAGELDVLIVGASGIPVEGATVRVSRDYVGLVLLEAVTGLDGRVSFGPLPSGTFRVTAEAPGLRTAAEEVGLEGDAQVALQLLPGARVAGTVTDPDGKPVDGAVVAIYVEDEVPAAIVGTDAEGKFAASGLRMGPTFAVATRAGFAAGVSSQIDTTEGVERIDIQLQRAVSFDVRVVTESDEPVRNASVVWSDQLSGATRGVQTDDQGRARFDSVVPGALLSAELRGWSSQEHLVTRADQGKTIELVLTKGEPPKRLRIAGLPDDFVSLELVSSTGTRCRLTSIDERDFWVSGCPDGEAILTVVSESRGTATVKLALGDGASAKLPDPQQLTVRVTVTKPGVSPTADWSDGERWRRFDLAAVDEQVWEGKATLYPGRYFTRASANGHAPEESSISLRSSPQNAEVTLEEMVRHKVFVLDVRRATVTGARVEIWSGSERIRVARSAGQLPVVVERPNGDGWFVVAIDPQRGEKRAMLDAPRLELEMTDPVGSTTTPGRMTPTQLAGKAGVQFARDGEAWVFDPVPGSEAAKVLERGDRYVTARRLGSSVEIVIERRSSTKTVRLEIP